MSAISKKISSGIHSIESGNEPEVNLSGCQISLSLIQRIATALKNNVPLMSLDLSNTSINEDGGQLLLTALKINYTLKKLHLVGTDISKETQATLFNLTRRNITIADRTKEVQFLNKQGKTQEVITKLRLIQKESSMDPIGLTRLFGFENTNQLLSSKGAPVEFEGWSPLHLAAYQGDSGEVDRLIREGADLYAKTPTGHTPYDLVQEIQKNSEGLFDPDCCEEIEDLLRGKANALYLQDTTTKIDDWLAAGATLEDLPPEETQRVKEHLNEILLDAAEKDQPTEILLRYVLGGADIDSRKQDGRTSLHLTTKGGNVRSIQVLLSHGATVNIQDKDGNTPLHIAVIEEQETTIPILVTYGGDLCIKNNKNQTPLSLAENSSQEVKACVDEVKKIKKSLELQMEEINKLRKHTHIQLLEEINRLINHPQFSAFYSYFYNTLTSALTNEMLGLKTALSHFVEQKPSNSQKTLAAASSLGKFIPLPGASVIVSILGAIPQEALRRHESKPLEKLADYLNDLVKIDLVIKTLSLNLLILLEQQIPIFDKFNKDSQMVEVDKKAIKTLVNSLISRLFGFMLSEHFLDAQVENELDLLTESLTYFNPSAYFKINRSEFPGIDTDIIFLPTLNKRTIRGKALDKPRALIKGNQSFKGNKKRLTDKGLLQRAPLKVGNAYYSTKPCRAECYPPLSFSKPPTERKNNSYSPVQSLSDRKTFSYRELIAYWKTIENNPGTQDYEAIKKAIELISFKNLISPVVPEPPSSSSSSIVHSASPTGLPEALARIEKQDKQIQAILKRLEKLENNNNQIQPLLKRVEILEKKMKK